MEREIWWNYKILKITVIGEGSTDRQEREVAFIMFCRFNFTQSSQRKVCSGVMCRINKKTGEVCKQS